MSGFEALGLACCVFQTISFTRETAKVCKAIYQGQKTPDSTLEENATAMIQAADEAKASCRGISTPEGKCLADIAGECAETGKKLEKEVQTITKLHKQGDFLAAVRDGARNTMQSLLINRICNQNKALELQQRQEFDKLDQTLQAFIANIAAGRTNMEDLLRTEGNLTRTLVRYIIDNEATQTLLNQWHSGTRMISHYFWKIGSPMQNNIQGLFCSLLHQMLQDNEKLVSFLIRTFPFTERKRNPHDWSERDLERVLLAALKAKEVEQPVCIFIDGLDEYNGNDGDHGLMKRIRKLIELDKVKLCVASRPEPRLLNQLNEAPCLRLQDLTRPDMRAHIQTTFAEIVPNGNLSDEEMSVLTNHLLEKAEGAFLWVHLAMQNVVCGIENEDPWDLLVARLMQLPNALEDLYTDMWKRLNQDQPLYREAAATEKSLKPGPIWKEMVLA